MDWCWNIIPVHHCVGQLSTWYSRLSFQCGSCLSFPAVLGFHNTYSHTWYPHLSFQPALHLHVLNSDLSLPVDLIQCLLPLKHTDTPPPQTFWYTPLSPNTCDDITQVMTDWNLDIVKLPALIYRPPHLCPHFAVFSAFLLKWITSAVEQTGRSIPISDPFNRNTVACPKSAAPAQGADRLICDNQIVEKYT